MKKIGRRSVALLIALALLVIPVLAAPVNADVTSVDILQPTTAAPAAAISGGSIDVTVAVTVDTSDYYTVMIMITDNATSTVIAGSDIDLVQLNGGTNVITKLIPLMPGLCTGTYDVLAVADLPGEFNPIPPASPFDVEANALIIGEIPGASVGVILVAKPVMITEAILDKFMPPSGLGDMLGCDPQYAGNAYEALSGEGKALVDGTALLASNGMAIAGGVISGVRGGVVTYVPMIVNGVLKILSTL
jgi:hypothetical protein